MEQGQNYPMHLAAAGTRRPSQTTCANPHLPLPTILFPRIGYEINHVSSPGKSQNMLPAEEQEMGVYVGKPQLLYLTQGHTFSSPEHSSHQTSDGSWGQVCPEISKSFI